MWKSTAKQLKKVNWRERERERQEPGESVSWVKRRYGAMTAG